MGAWGMSVADCLNCPKDFVNDFSTFVSTKDPIPKRYKNSVVYQFTCPGCCSYYIGKTDRCLYTRIKEHAKSDKSEICNHVHNCKKFQYIRTFLNFPATLLNCNYSTRVVDLINNYCKIIDRSNDWALLLFKEAFNI